MKAVISIFLCCQFMVLFVNAADDIKFKESWIEFNKSVIQSRSQDVSIYKDITINPHDTEKECYEKLLHNGAYFWKNPSIESQDNLLTLYREAIKLHPDSVMLKASYLPYYHNKDIHTNTNYCIKELAFLLESDNPYVIEALVYILNSLRVNACMHQENSPITYKNIYEFLGCPYDYFSAKKRLTVLTQFWLSKLPYGIDDKKFDEKIKKAKLEMANPEMELQAWKYWSIMLYNIGFQDAKIQELTLAQEQQNLNDQAIAEKQKKQQIEEAIRFQKTLKELDVFAVLPNDSQKIELTLNHVTFYRSKFKKEYPDIPNYDELVKKIGSSEADVVNIAYKVYILRETKVCLEEIAKLKNVDHDPRLLAIKIYCMQKEKYPPMDIIKNIDQLLKIEPRNQRALMLKKMLKEQE